MIRIGLRDLFVVGQWVRTPRSKQRGKNRLLVLPLVEV